MNIHYFQHVPFEGLGYIENWVSSNKHNLTVTRFYENYILPDLTDIDWLIIMGGPMGVNDENKFSWLKEETNFINSAIEANKTVIGICLGAQLIAKTLGSKVYHNAYKEIGWFEIMLTSEAETNVLVKDFPKTFQAFHWHGDTFDLPENSIHLMKSTACQNQAFLFRENVIGLQFHLEATPDTLIEMVSNGTDELISNEYIQPGETILSNRDRTEYTNMLLKQILDRLAIFKKPQ